MPRYAIIINKPIHDIHATCVSEVVEADNATEAREKGIIKHFGKLKPCTCSVVELFEEKKSGRIIVSGWDNSGSVDPCKRELGKSEEMGVFRG